MRTTPYIRPESSVSDSAPIGDTEQLRELIAANPRLFVITGAGISSASGIPTYRDEIGNWNSNTPIQHGDFLKEASVRQRYWARSFVGWPNVGKAKPNSAHHGLVELEKLGYVTSLVTQNVDRLHQKAGQRKVTDLHGRLDQVVCMDCGVVNSRHDVQDWLWQNNPHLEGLELEIRPDGDADVQEDLIDQVKIPSCQSCGGLLKPNVVFYGGSVDREKVNYLYDKLEGADSLLVVGSSLMVYSSYRFCKFAAERNIPIYCINEGLTRADGLLALKVAEDCGQVLTTLATELPALSSS